MYDFFCTEGSMSFSPALAALKRVRRPASSSPLAQHRASSVNEHLLCTGSDPPSRTGFSARLGFSLPESSMIFTSLVTTDRKRGERASWPAREAQAEMQEAVGPRAFGVWSRKTLKSSTSQF